MPVRPRISLSRILPAKVVVFSILAVYYLAVIGVGSYFLLFREVGSGRGAFSGFDICRLIWLIFLITLVIYPLLLSLMSSLAKRKPHGLWRTDCYRALHIYSAAYYAVLVIGLLQLFFLLYFVYGESAFPRTNELCTLLSVFLGATAVTGIIAVYLHRKEAQKRFFTFDDLLNKVIEILKNTYNDNIKIITLSPVMGNISSPATSDRYLEELKKVSDRGNSVLMVYLCGQNEAYNIVANHFEDVTAELKDGNDPLNFRESMIKNNQPEKPLWERVYKPFIRSDSSNANEIFDKYVSALINVGKLKNDMRGYLSLVKLNAEDHPELVIVKSSKKAVVSIPIEYPFKKSGFNPGYGNIEKGEGGHSIILPVRIMQQIRAIAASDITEIHWVGFVIDDPAILIHLDRYMLNFIEPPAPIALAPPANS